MQNYLIQQTVDLSAPTLELVYFDGVLGDVGAHTWRVTVRNGGAAVDLTGATVTATMFREDGVSVLLSGGVSGNVASVVLTQECYAVTGIVRGSLVVLKDGAKVTEAICEGNISRRAGNVIVMPGTPIPDPAAILAMVNDVNAATKAAQIAANMSAGLNLLNNTGLYSGLNGYNLSNVISRDTSQNIYGSNSFKISQTGQGATGQYGTSAGSGNQPVPIQSQTYTLSMYIKVLDASLFDAAIFISANIRDAGGAYLQSPSVDYTPIAADNGRWVLKTLTFTVAVSTGSIIQPFFGLRKNGTFYAACLKLELGNTATPWRPSWADILTLPYAEDWKAPTLINGASEISGNAVGYYKDATGIVRFKGRLVPATSAPSFYLPVGYRPLLNTKFALARDDNTSTIARCYVNTNGEFACEPNIAPSFIYLSQLFFRSEG